MNRTAAVVVGEREVDGVQEAAGRVEARTELEVARGAAAAVVAAHGGNGEKGARGGARAEAGRAQLRAAVERGGERGAERRQVRREGEALLVVAERLERRSGVWPGLGPRGRVRGRQVGVDACGKGGVFVAQLLGRAPPLERRALLVVAPPRVLRLLLGGGVVGRREAPALHRAPHPGPAPAGISSTRPGRIAARAAGDATGGAGASAGAAPARLRLVGILGRRAHATATRRL
jgi:hypothetical protein